MTNKITPMAQGPAKLASSHELQLDTHGLTNPNLHTRIEAHQPEQGSEEVLPREYAISVQGVNSYRTTTRQYHNEDSEESEIP